MFFLANSQQPTANSQHPTANIQQPTSSPKPLPKRFLQHFYSFNGIAAPLQKEFVFLVVAELPGDIAVMQPSAKGVKQQGSRYADIEALGKAHHRDAHKIVSML